MVQPNQTDSVVNMYHPIDYVYWNDGSCGPSDFPPPDNSPDGCFVGSNPQPWFIDVSTSDFSMSGAQSDWAPVENALGAIHVGKVVPSSWCSSDACPYPGEPSGGGGFSFGGGD
jgi:hypothetical protein